MSEYGAYDLAMTLCAGFLMIGLGASVRIVGWLIPVGFLLSLATLIEIYGRLWVFAETNWAYLLCVGVVTLGMVIFGLRAAVASRSSTKSSAESPQVKGLVSNQRERINQSIASNNRSELALIKRSKKRLRTGGKS